MPWSLSKHWSAFSDRGFHLSAVNMDKEVSKKEAFAGEDALSKVPTTKFDKFLFVWSGKYKRMEEVPKYVARSALLKCHSVCRVKACNYMIAITLISAFFYALSGKEDAKKGLTVVEMNRQWHRDYNKKFEEGEKNP